MILGHWNESMKSYNYYDIFVTARLGYAVLPNLTLYNPQDQLQKCIDLEDDLVISYYIKGNKKYFNYLEEKAIKPAINTLSKKGFEIYKEQIWKEFDKYQTNNTPRYLESKNYTKRKILSEQEFYDAIYYEYKKIEEGSLWELFRAERKTKALKNICIKYDLDYKSFYERMVKEGEVVID